MAYARQNVKAFHLDAATERWHYLPTRNQSPNPPTRHWHFLPRKLPLFYHDAEKKGYSGVALYCKKQPDQLINGLGWTDIDSEGRFIEAQFGQLSVISLYLPSGSSGEERQVFKFSVLDRLLPYLQQRVSENRDFIICGDWNIAHQAIDLKNWRGIKKTQGFYPKNVHG